MVICGAEGAVPREGKIAPPITMKIDDLASVRGIADREIHGMVLALQKFQCCVAHENANKCPQVHNDWEDPCREHPYRSI